MLQLTPPLCEVSGKPIVVKDTVQFRIEDEDDAAVAYIPARGNKEERLRIVSTELKVLPPLPATTNPSVGESCAVLGNGMDLVQSQYSIDLGSPPAFSDVPATVTDNSPAMPTGPVMAIPVTGGPPVPVIATGPVTGGVMTGIPVTGGVPVTAIPVAPVPGTTTVATALLDRSVSAYPNSTTSTTFTASEWDPFLRVQTAGKIYKLTCSVKECWLKYREPQLGDLLTIRIKNGVAYLSWQPPGPKGEQKFAILSVDNVDEP